MSAPVTEYVSVRMSDGYSVTVTRYRPAARPKAIVVMNHGIQSHAAWFETTSREWAAAGYDVWFADRRGSGRNADQRGHARSGQRLIEDARQVIRTARASTPDVPVIMGGLCWGGKIAAAIAADNHSSIDGLLLLYPGLWPRVKGRLRDRFRLHAGRFLGAQNTTVPLPLPPELFTSDVQKQSFIRNDPEALTRASVGMLFSGRDLDRFRRARNVCCPTLLLLAGEDAVIHNRKAAQWAGKTTGTTVTKTYHDARHVLEFESVRPTMSRDVLDWLETIPSLDVHK